jgi:hypothetical protein
MATLPDIHSALAGRLALIDGLRVFPYPPQAGVPPTAHVHLMEWAPTAFGRQGPRMHTFEVVVLTAETIRPQDGYGLLIEFVDTTGARSIDTAIWDGNNRQAGTFAGTFAGTTYTCQQTQAQVVGFRVLGAQEMDELQMYGGAFAVNVTTSI